MVGRYVRRSVFLFYKKSPQFTPPNYEKIGLGFDLPYDASAFSPQKGLLLIVLIVWIFQVFLFATTKGVI